MPRAKKWLAKGLNCIDNSALALIILYAYPVSIISSKVRFIEQGVKYCPIPVSIISSKVRFLGQGIKVLSYTCLYH